MEYLIKSLLGLGLTYPINHNEETLRKPVISDIEIIESNKIRMEKNIVKESSSLRQIEAYSDSKQSKQSVESKSSSDSDGFDHKCIPSRKTGKYSDINIYKI